jgi:hypothetical protein
MIKQLTTFARIFATPLLTAPLIVGGISNPARSITVPQTPVHATNSHELSINSPLQPAE